MNVECSIITYFSCKGFWKILHLMLYFILLSIVQSDNCNIINNKQM